MTKASSRKAAIRVNERVEKLAIGSKAYMRQTLQMGVLTATRTSLIENGRLVAVANRRIDALNDLLNLQKSLQQELQNVGYPLNGSSQDKLNWYKFIIADTVPIEELHLKAQVLHHLSILLAGGFPQEYLENVRILLHNWGQLRIAGVNGLASRGITAQQSLAKGPASRKRSGDQKREIICRQAEDYWREKAALRGNKVSTAEAITESVNLELVSQGLRRMRPKTIADHIAKGIAG